MAVFPNPREADVPNDASTQDRDPRSPDSPQYDEQFHGDAVNVLGDQDAVNLAGAEGDPAPDPLPEPTPQLIRRHPSWWDDETIASFDYELDEDGRPPVSGEVAEDEVAEDEAPGPDTTGPAVTDSGTINIP